MPSPVRPLQRTVSAALAPAVTVVTAAYRPERAWLEAAGHAIAATGQRLGMALEWVVRFDGADTVPSWFSSPAGISVKVSASDGQAHGIAATRNLALASASGSFIAGCDHDDVWQPDGMAQVIRAALRTGTWAAGRAIDLDASGQCIARVQDPFDAGLVPAGGLYDTWQALGYFPIWCNAGVVNAALWRAVGGWAALPRSDDLSSWCAVSELAAGEWVPVDAYGWRRHPAQTTDRDWYVQARETAWTAVRDRVEAMRAVQALPARRAS